MPRRHSRRRRDRDSDSGGSPLPMIIGVVVVVVVGIAFLVVTDGEKPTHTPVRPTVRPPTKPQPTKNQPTVPTVTEPRPTEATANELQPIEPVRIAPQPIEPVRITPQPIEPVKTAPQPTEPTMTAPQPTEPTMTVSQPIEPVRTAPQPKDPLENPDPSEDPLDDPYPFENPVEDPDPFENPVENPDPPKEPTTAAPQPADPSVAVSQPADQAVAVSKPADPAVAVSQPADQAVAVSQPADPAVAESQPADPAVTVSQPADSAVTVSQPADSAVAVSQPADPAVAVPQPANPALAAPPPKGAPTVPPTVSPTVSVVVPPKPPVEYAEAGPNAVSSSEERTERIKDADGTMTVTPKMPQCETASCQETKLFLGDSMSKTSKPCTNFFEYACGNWLAKSNNQPTHLETVEKSMLEKIHNLLTSVPISANDALAVNMTRSLYRSCLNDSKYGTLDKLVTELDSYGGWPMTVDKWQPTRDWINQSVRLQLELDEPVFIGVHVRTHNFQSPKIFLPDRNAYPAVLDSLNNEGGQNATNYRQFIISAAKLIRDKIRSTVTDKAIGDDVTKMIAFEKEYSKCLPPKHPTIQCTAKDKIMAKPSVHATLIALINKVAEFSEIEKNVAIVNATLCIRNDPTKMLAMLDNKTIADDRTVANYLGWRAVMKLIRFVKDDSNATISFEFDKRLNEQNFANVKKRNCLNMIKQNGLLNAAISKKLIERELASTNENDEMGDMSSRIGETFIKQVNETDWMANNTDEPILKADVAKRKATLMHPHWIHDDNVFNYFYRNLNMSDNNLYDDMKSYYKFASAANLRPLPGVETGIRDYSPARIRSHNYRILDPLLMNGGEYDPQLNRVFIPAVNAMSTSSFREDRWAASNYAGLGTMIARNLASALNPSYYRTQWREYFQDWPDNLVTQYDKKKQCFINLYDNSPLRIVGKTVQADGSNQIIGSATIDRNMDDNVGLKVAYHAYQDFIGDYRKFIGKPDFTEGPVTLPNGANLTADQMFFVSYAQQFCSASTVVPDMKQLSPAYRLMITLGNSPEFAEAFNCEPEDPMVYKNRCPMWGKQWKD